MTSKFYTYWKPFSYITPNISETLSFGAQMKTNPQLIKRFDYNFNCLNSRIVWPFLPQSMFTKIACKSSPKAIRFSPATFLLTFKLHSSSIGTSYVQLRVSGSISVRVRHSSRASTLLSPMGLLYGRRTTACGGFYGPRSSHRYRRIDGVSCGAWDGSPPRLSRGKVMKGMEGEYIVCGGAEYILEWEGSHEIIIMPVCGCRGYFGCFR